MSIRNKSIAMVVAVTTIVWLSGFGAFVPRASAQTIQDLLDQIAALQAQLLALQGSTSQAACTFTKSLFTGVSDPEVKCLQQYLNGAGFTLASSGAGSPGNETNYYGSRTKAAVAAWQAANSVSPAVGYFGPISRAKYSSLAVTTGGGPTTTTSPTPTPTAGAGTGLTVTLASNQPTPGLFGESFASRAFTAVSFTASSDGDITVDELTVERTGQANDAVFNGVVLLDDQMQRVGDAKTFGSDHTLRLTDDFVVKAGQTMTMTLAGDSDSDQNDYNGQIASLSLKAVKVSGSATVNGTFPMTGTAHTVNSTLSIGALTLTRGALDPGAGVTKEIGTIGYTFAGLKLTAGSNEDVIVKSIKFNQSSSAASADLANVVVNVAGTDYPTTVSSDGKYYTAIFGTGVTLGKGNNTELYVKGDVVSGSNRGVDFDLYRYADLKATGAIYGYDILPTATNSGGSATDDDGSLQNANPNYDAYEATIGSGSLSVAKDASVGSTNITTNLGDQVLGGFTVDVKGEQVSVAAINFDASFTEAAGTGGSVDTNDFTSITLVDSAGTVVAGPVDGVAGGNNAVRFTDTVTFPIGLNKYVLKAKLSTDFSQSDQVAASTTPSSDWTTVKGVVSGTTITPSGGTVTLSTMTVKTGALAVSMDPGTASSTPDANAVAGTNAVTFAKIVLSASNSGEDLRINSMKVDLTTAQPGNANDDLTNCQMWDGSTALNTGTNAVNPTNSQAAGADYLFTFDTGLIITKSQTKTLELKCNLVAGGTATRLGFGLGNLTTAADQVVVSGVTSGTSIAETVTSDNGLTVVVRSGGTLSLALDSSSPSLALVQAGKTGNTLSVFRLNALYEDVRVDQIGLQLATSSSAGGAYNANASNSPNDLTLVTLWDGSTQVGSTVFTSDYATATLNYLGNSFIVPANSQKLLTVKGDVSAVDVQLTKAIPGHLINVDFDAAWGDLADDDANEGAQGVDATGVSSGTKLYNGSAADTASNGARVVAAIPTITKISTSGKFTNTNDQVLYQFRVDAPAGTNGVGLYKFTFNISTNTSSVVELPGAGSVDPAFSGDFAITNLRVFCYSDSNFQNGSCGNSTGQLNQYGLLMADGAAATVDFDDAVTSGDPDVDAGFLFNPTASSGSTAEAIVVSPGTSRWFALKGNIAGASSTPTISTKLLGDGAWFARSCSGDNAKLLVGNCDYAIASGEADSGSSFFTTRPDFIHGTSSASADDAEVEDDFIWTDNATNTSQSVNAYSWMNGFLIPGLSDGGTAESLTL